jgi:hypothetical protein
MIKESKLTDNTRKELLLALSAQYFTNKEKIKAFEMLHTANQTVSITQEMRDDIDKTFNKIKKFYKNGINFNCDGSGSNTPIFIIGMPRSGTTLLENVLASHSNVFAAGETNNIFRNLNGKRIVENTHLMHTKYFDEIDQWDNDKFISVANLYIKDLRKYSNKEPRVVDKMPHNFLYLGILKKLFPKAKIIHIKRNPIACCLSIYKQNFRAFHNYGTNLEYLAEYYKKYQDLMLFWNKHISQDNYIEINYEEIVINQKTETRKILEFCELSFEEPCLNFQEKKRVVNTASKEQVRNKIYKSSLKPWQGIEDEIRPLITAFPEYYD